MNIYLERLMTFFLIKKLVVFIDSLKAIKKL